VDQPTFLLNINPLSRAGSLVCLDLKGWVGLKLVI
jgi:hypothetical protein